MVRTELKGFQRQYRKELVDELNAVYGRAKLYKGLLPAAGEQCPEYRGHNGHVETADGYNWHGRLDFRVNTCPDCWFGKYDTIFTRADVAVLFPWCRNLKNPMNMMDRSINVYSGGRVPRKVLEDLLGRLAHEIEARIPT